MAAIFNGVMRVICSLIGLAMLLMGLVWILQGLNIAFLGGFMANDRQWILWGVLLAVTGICQIVWCNTRERYYRGR